MKYKAVIFDLFGTLIENFSLREYQSVLRNMASIVSVPSDDFIRLWFDTFDERAIGVFRSTEANIEHVCRMLRVDLDDDRIKLAAQIRFDFTVRSITPRADAIETLSHLKSAGYKIGLITDCDVDTPTVWQGTPFTLLIDVAVFSCLVGLKKPDPRIYQLATDQLEINPQECLYIGDGSSRELSGAMQVGMNPILIRTLDDPTDAHQIDAEEWDGPVISSLTEVMTLLS